MIGNLYFIAKSSIITFMIVCLLQIQFKNKTLEDRLMNFVRTSLAPTVLGLEKININHDDFTMSPEEIVMIRTKILNSDALKGVRKNVKKVFIREMENVLKEQQESRSEKNND